MLKWLKQKQPSGPLLRGGSSNEGSHEVAQNKIITDDPLATIQVHHPQQKKSKNKSEEIYAVSRVNPLFEEEEVPKVVLSGGNRSGSSGYDSGSQAQSDDDELKSPLHLRRTRDASSSTSSTSSFSALSRAPVKHGQLFRDEDDPVVHSQAAILSENGRPVLHIVEQNPDFVHSIAVSIGGRPLSPIDESNIKRSYHLAADAIFTPKHNYNSTKVSVHPVPTRKDNVGVAKILQKDNRYVQSIIIGAPSPEGKSATLSSVSKLTHLTTPAPPPLPLPLSKKPSVTFSERVELVAPKETNDKVLVKKGQSPAYRKTSTEQDSIVTESLLLLTSSKPLDLNKGNENNTNRLLNHHSSKSGERKVSSSSCSSGGGNGISGVQRNQDLEAFSSSIRKNHPVKHILSSSGKSLEINQAADQYSSNEYLDHHNNHHHHQNKSEDDSSCGSDGQGHNNETGSSLNEQGDDDDGDEGKECEEKRHCRRTRGSCPKSPFGGIADHYADAKGAAKEIAKEIESYSNGSAKTNSKKSIVRDLLSGRGREALAFHTAIRKAAAAESNKSGSSPSHPDQFPMKHKFGNGNQDSPSSCQAYPISNDAIEEWESVRVQQVYLKGRSWKEVEPSSSSAVSSSSSHEDGDCFRFAGQRQKDTIAHSTTPASTTIHSSVQPSLSLSKQQHLKLISKLVPISGEVIGQRFSVAARCPPSVADNSGVRRLSMQINSDSVQTHEYYYHNHTLKRQKDFHHNISTKIDDGEDDALFYRRLSDQCSEHSTSSGVDIDTCSSAGGEGDAESGEEENSTPRSPNPSKATSSSSSIYCGDGLSSEGASSHNEGDDDASSDSGNSTDRNSKGTNEPIPLQDRRATTSRSKIPVKAPDRNSHTPEETVSVAGLSHVDKVMIVTGDSQNMVVDLSGVPQDLREAIISGTALITLPDGLTASSAKKGGYTIISLPNNNPTTNAISSTATSSSNHRSRIGDGGLTGHNKTHSNTKIDVENEIKTFPMIPSTSVNLNVSQLERGELYDHIFNSYKYGTKNKTQMWNVMQQSVQQTLIEGENGKKKRITTVLPFHPNQDVNKSPDFTMDGQRIERQRKKLDVAKKRRCACRVFGIFFFLATFIGVLVALSMIYTKGQRYFGSV